LSCLLVGDQQTDNPYRGGVVCLPVQSVYLSVSAGSRERGKNASTTHQKAERHRALHTDQGTALGRDGWYINIQRHHSRGLEWEQVFLCPWCGRQSTGETDPL
jgi:hypothetical protein